MTKSIKILSAEVTSEDSAESFGNARTCGRIAANAPGSLAMRLQFGHRIAPVESTSAHQATPPVHESASIRPKDCWLAQLGPLWPGTWAKYTQTARMICTDLAAARSAWLAEAKDHHERTARELTLVWKLLLGHSIRHHSSNPAASVKIPDE
jgi:hypothetical protein